MTLTRLRILKQFVRGNRNGTTLLQVLKVFFGLPYLLKWKAQIDNIMMDKGFYIVKLNALRDPLFYPVEMSLKSLGQVIVETLYRDNWHYYQIASTRVMPDDVVLDCGAGEGLFTLSIAETCRRVYCIEPLPRFAEALKNTFRFHNNVIIMQCALSNERSDISIKSDGISSSLSTSNLGALTVECDTLDNLFYCKNIYVNYIKADLEGHEMQALEGAERLIAHCKPKLAVATYHNPDHAKRIEEYLRRIDSSYRVITKGIYQDSGCPVMLHAWCE